MVKSIILSESKPGAVGSEASVVDSAVYSALSRLLVQVSASPVRTTNMLSTEIYSFKSAASVGHKSKILPIHGSTASSCDVSHTGVGVTETNSRNAASPVVEVNNTSTTSISPVNSEQLLVAVRDILSKVCFSQLEGFLLP
jgi:hypothetical protein